MSALLAPAPAPSRWDRVRAPLVTIGGLGLATLALHLRDPHVGGSWGICPSAAMGFWCPGCGGLRAVNDLTHGDVVSAASSNLLLVVLMPFAVIALAVWTLDRWQGRTRRLPRGVVVVGGWALLGTALVFSLLYAVTSH